MRMLRHERVTLLVIPEAGGRTYEFKILRVAIWGAFCGGLGVVALLLAGLFFYLEARASGQQIARLQREKGLLQEEVTRIDELERVLLKLQRGNQQLRSILGEAVQAEEEPQRVRGQSRYESFVEPRDRLRWGHLRTFPGMWPIDGTVLSPFEERRGGVVIEAPSGSLVWAAGAGQVSRAGYDEVLGLVVCIDHGGGLTSTYGYARQVLVEDGEYIEKGQPLALSGSSGQATSASLYFAVHANGHPVDPLALRLWL
jgi:murein DD-endopeptidase MepM/ murein hydrolase activator NlpD